MGTGALANAGSGKEEELSERMQCLYAGVVGQVLTELLSEPSYLEVLRRLGGRRGMRFKEYRWATVRVGRGQGIEVAAPYFVKAGAKRGPNGRGAQLNTPGKAGGLLDERLKEALKPWPPKAAAILPSPFAKGGLRGILQRLPFARPP
jgi:hypothetical protein